MVKMILRGCNGRMGRVITELIKNYNDIEIVAGIDVFDDGHNSYPVFKTLEDCEKKADVVVDFASPDNFERFMMTLTDRKLAVVLCTTGLNEEQLALVGKASEVIPVLRSANMSMGINTIIKLLKMITGTLTDAGFDVDIVERHHNQKLDAPSGTAIALADAINSEVGNEYEYVYDRSTRREKRPKKEIGISAVRGGTIVGEHEVIFAGTDEVIEIKHTAYSRAVFGNGAVCAARFLAGKPAGMYSMSDVIEA